MPLSDFVLGFLKYGAPIVALLAVFISVAGIWRSRWEEKKKRQLAYFSDIRRWADEACDLATDAIHLCDLDPERTVEPSFFERRHRLLTGLSSSIDKGRWFFPNTALDEHGAHKLEDFKGYRHDVLDGLTASYKVLRTVDFKVKQNNLGPRRDALVEAKKQFVGQVQKVLDPRTQGREYKIISSEKLGRLGAD